MGQNKYEIADVINLFGNEFIKKHKVNAWQSRTLNALKICRTAALGGHKEECSGCGYIRYNYNSCKNRHCPKCQTSKQAFWVEDISEKIIDTKYFHIVFTVPDILNQICLLNSSFFYNAMFKSVWHTLQTFGYTKHAVESGAVAVLHTWGQNLSLHPHIHCLVPTLGLGFNDKLKKISKNGKYLYSVIQLSLTFKAALMKSIKKELSKTKQLSLYQNIIDGAYAKKWVVFSKPSFNNALKVIKYLGQYIHKVAINNKRIVNIDKKDKKVTFFYKDYRNNSKIKPTTMDAIEFLRRFCMHILPKRFVKIRYYGILSNRFSDKIVFYKKASGKIEGETVVERLRRLTGFDICKCPKCKKGKMKTVEEIPKIRLPVKDFLF
jgi:hypothetical protein